MSEPNEEDDGTSTVGLATGQEPDVQVSNLSTNIKYGIGSQISPCTVFDGEDLLLCGSCHKIYDN